MLSATNDPNYLNTSEPLYTLEHKAIGLRYDYYSETFRNLAKDWAKLSTCVPREIEITHEVACCLVGEVTKTYWFGIIIICYPNFAITD